MKMNFLIKIKNRQKSRPNFGDFDNKEITKGVEKLPK